MIRFLTTWGYVGLAPFAPGTWGSLAALPFAFILYRVFGWYGFVLATAFVFVIGWWATAQATAGGENPDPSEIVIDEVAGQWVALIPILGAMDTILNMSDETSLSVIGFLRFMIVAILPFALFRLFDIWKPYPVSWADNLHSPLGVMLDDVLAGMLVWAPTLVAYYLILIGLSR